MAVFGRAFGILIPRDVHQSEIVSFLVSVVHFFFVFSLRPGTSDVAAIHGGVHPPGF